MIEKRDIGNELLEAITAIKQGKGKKYTINTPDDVKEIRENLDLSQSIFASLMGVSIRTLQEWEQGAEENQAALHVPCFVLLSSTLRFLFIINKSLKRISF